MVSHLLALGLAFTLVLPLASTAGAQATADELARAHFQSASAYYEQRRYEEAAREFLEAYRLSPRPQLLENVARSQERALLFDESIATIEMMAQAHPDFQDEATLRERIRALEVLRDRLRGGSRPTEEPATADQSPSTEPVASTPPAASSGGGVSIPGIVVVSLGGALGITSLITGLVSNSMYEDVRASCVMGICPASRQGDIDTGNALAITSTVTMFAAAVAVGVGVVLLVIDNGGSAETARLELMPGPGEAGLGTRLRF